MGAVDAYRRNCWLTLAQAHVPSSVIITLLERFGAAEVLFKQSRIELLPYVAQHPSTLELLLREPNNDVIAPALRWLEIPSNQLVTWGDTVYPPQLRHIPDPPALLFVSGNPTLLACAQIAVVGSRNPTTGGEENAFAFAAYLAQAGLAVTSGMALGIDAAAHRGALSVGGATIAVAGTGLDRVYPARHRTLAHEIAAQGALISEFAIGSPPRRHHFPQRNRLISGLSLGTLVVEAALNSGSLITARLAADQGREVFAIPGSIHSPLARGCHTLIREGAKLVETAADILEELGPGYHTKADAQTALKNAQAIPAEIADLQVTQLLTHVGYDPVDVNMLIERTGLTSDAISSMLLQMELSGLIEARPGGKYLRTS